MATKRGRPKRKAETKALSLKIRKDIWEQWKILAIKEGTTMSELGERLIADYIKRKRG